MIKYVDFTSSNEFIESKDYTNRWADCIKCKIVLSDMSKDVYHKIMVMEDKDSVEIDKWLSKNPGKVKEITKGEANDLGRLISPTDITKTYNCPHCNKLISIKSGSFSVDTGQIWTEVSV